MKNTILFSTSLVLGLTSIASSSFAYPISKSNTDTALVSVEVLPTSIHFGEVSKNANIEIGAKDCFTVLKTTMGVAEFDCSTAVSAKLGKAIPELANAPLIYPAYLHVWQTKTGANDPNAPLLYDDAADAQILKIVTATTLDAANAQSFSGMGFFRMGYPISASEIYSAYNLNDPAVKSSYSNSLATSEAFPLANLSAYAKTGIRNSDGKAVVYHVFTMVLLKRYYETSFFDPSGFQYTINQANIALHPFAQFTANGQDYWNYESKSDNRDYSVPTQAPNGFVIDQRANYSSSP